MYYCQDCEREFIKLKKLSETHSLYFPPYEEFYVCPFCNSGRVSKIPVQHCACCGAKIKNSEKYCSEECRIRGEYLWAKQRREKDYWQNHPLYVAVREVEEYNKQHGTHLSYGEYFAGVR